MIQINPLKSYIDGGVRAALTTPPSASLVFDLPGKAIWVKGVKLKGIDHTYTFNHDNYITLTNTPDKNNPESEDIKIGVNITTLKNVIDTTYNGGTLALLQEGLNTEERTWQAKILHNYINNVLPITKNLKINGTNYAIYTIEDSLPQFFVPISLGATGQILACTSSGLIWVDQIQNTDYRVSQSSATSNSDYRIILKQGANNNPETDFVRFSEYLTFNPYTKTLKINNIKVITATDIYAGSTAGLVPTATSAQYNYYLRGDGTWVNIATEIAAANTWRPIKVGNTDALGSGTNTGTLSFIAGTGIALSWDATNKRIIITNSSPDVNHNTDENVRQVPKTDNINRPLMMINGGTSAREQINTSMFSTGIYANASTKMIIANGFIKAGSSDSYVLLGGGGHKLISDFATSNHNHYRIKLSDDRAKYPGQLTGNDTMSTFGGFMQNSTLGISNFGSYSDVLVIRSYADSSGGNDNAIIFNKNTRGVWHTQFGFGSTTSWGTPYLFLDSNNFNKYTPTLTGTGASGTWNINISGNANTATNSTSSSYAKNLLGRTTSGTDYSATDGNLIFAEWNTYSDNRWYLKAKGYETRVGYANNANTALLLALNTNPISTVATAIGGWSPVSDKVYVYRQRWTNSAAGSDTADLSIYLDGNLTANMCLDGYYYSLLGFKKGGSSDSYVLLGGGGHKAISDFSMFHSHPYLPLAGGNMTGPIKFSYNDNGNCNVSRTSGFSMFYGNQENATNYGFPFRYSSVISFMTGYCGMQFANYGGNGDTRLLFRNISDQNTWTNWYHILHSGNSSVTKSEQTITVTINGTSQSLTNSTYNFSGASFTSGNYNTAEHNANNITSNGVWYYTSNGPTTSLGASTSDGALYSQAYNSNWVGQIAQNYRDGDLFTRGKNYGTWTTWKRVAYTNDIPTVTDYYWANIKVSPTSSTGTYPIFGSLSVVNDSCNNSTDALAYFQHRSNNDWTVKIDSGSYDYGLYINTSGNYALSVGPGASRFRGSVIVGADATPAYTLDVRGTSGFVGDTMVGSKSIYYQRGTRGAIHHEIIGDDCDYGVMKIRHLSTEGSGVPGSYTASLAIFDERADTITGSYQPTFYINRSGATRTPALIGIDVGGSRKFTIDSFGNLTSIGSSTLGSISANTPFTVSRSYQHTSAFVRFSHGWEKAFTTYDDFILSSTDVATLRICESNGTELGLCGGDGHSTITSSKDLRFYTACSISGTIYSGASGTWGLTISGGNCTSTNYYTTSDRNKKQNISSFSEHIRKFQLKDTEKWHYGVIAQEVEEMFRDGEEGNMTVNYNSVLSFYIGQLENRVKELEDKLRKYENTL